MHKTLSIILITTFVIAFFTNCNSKSQKQEIHVEVKKTDSISTQEIFLQDTKFDYHNFKILTDSLLSNLLAEKSTFDMIIDTLTIDYEPRFNLIDLLIKDPESIVIQYSFILNPRQSYSFWIIDAKFKDSIVTKNCFDSLKFQSGPVSFDADNMPGLTYQNDYVISTKTNIFWLHSSCAYESKNQTKLKKIFLRSLQISTISDSINCNCGDVKCR